MTNVRWKLICPKMGQVQEGAGEEQRCRRGLGRSRGAGGTADVQKTQETILPVKKGC